MPTTAFFSISTKEEATILILLPVVYHNKILDNILRKTGSLRQNPRM
uniref:Uncharacterized protein n=1 Tax=Arundo donax TaxID=35708 RepID=A0A0A8Y5V8_ARUDO